MARSSTTFKPGQVTNPRGRPPTGKAITDEIKKVLELADVEVRQGKRKVRISRKEAVAQVLVRQALNGNPSALRLLMSYVDGLPVQRLEHTGEGGLPIEVVVFPGEFEESDANGETG